MKKFCLLFLLLILISCGDRRREDFLDHTIKAKYSGKVVVSIKETGAKESSNTGSIYCDVTLEDGLVKDTINYSKTGDGIYTVNIY